MSSTVKNWFGIAGIFALLVWAYGFTNIVGTIRAAVPAQNSVSVAGEGKVVAIPDIAQFSYSVINEGGKDIAKLQKDNTDKGNKIIDLLKKNGVEAKDIKTSSYDISPRYTTYNCYQTYGVDGSVKPCPPSEITGYTVTQSVSVKVRDFAKISNLLGGVATLGANNVSSLSFAVEDPDLLKTQARAEAIVKARAKAQAMASAGGFRLGRLLGVDEGSTGRNYYDYAAPMMSLKAESGGVASPAPVVEAGSQDITVTVTLRYEIR